MNVAVIVCKLRCSHWDAAENSCYEKFQAGEQRKKISVGINVVDVKQYWLLIAASVGKKHKV